MGGADTGVGGTRSGAVAAGDGVRVEAVGVEAAVGRAGELRLLVLLAQFLQFVVVLVCQLLQVLQTNMQMNIIQHEKFHETTRSKYVRALPFFSSYWAQQTFG